MASGGGSSGQIGGVSAQAMVLAGASIAGAAFIGYCIYFDHKRRSDPQYKQKIRERRRAAKASRAKSAHSIDIPIPNNPQDFQALFLQEVQTGEEMLSEGNIEEGTSHLANAIALCGQPRQLLGVFQQTLPQPVFMMLVQKLPAAQQRLQEGLRAHVAANGSASLLGEDGAPNIMLQAAGAGDADELGLEDDSDLE